MARTAVTTPRAKEIPGEKGRKLKTKAPVMAIAPIAIMVCLENFIFKATSS